MQSPLAHFLTENAAQAACLRLLGFSVSVRTTQSARTGGRTCLFAVAPQVLDAGGNVRFELTALMEQWRGGELVKIDPLHPFLCGLRALHNYKALLSWLKDGVSYSLAVVARNQASQYMPATVMYKEAPGDLTMRTNDLRLAAALGTLGIPVLAIEGQQPRHLFKLPARGYQLSMPGSDTLNGWYDAAHLARRVTQGSPEFAIERENLNHPFVYAILALRSYEELLALIKGKPTQLLLQSRINYQVTGLLSGEPSGKDLDRAAHAMGMPVRHLGK